MSGLSADARQRIVLEFLEEPFPSQFGFQYYARVLRRDAPDARRIPAFVQFAPRGRHHLVALGGKAKDYSNTLIDISEMAFWKDDSISALPMSTWAAKATRACVG